jgi:hypothetical protein
MAQYASGFESLWTYCTVQQYQTEAKFKEMKHYTHRCQIKGGLCTKYKKTSVLLLFQFRISLDKTKTCFQRFVLNPPLIFVNRQNVRVELHFFKHLRAVS